jgi:hypothetical protein
MGSKVSNLIKGKKVTTPADAIAADLKDLGRKGVGIQKRGLGYLKDYDPTAGITQGIERQKSMIAGGVDDARRKMNKMSAQRGLGGSSVGIGAVLGAEERAADKIRALDASKAGALSQARLSGAKNLMGVGKGLVSQRGPIRMNAVTKRKGGYGKLIGTAAGAAIGGPAGAQIGSGIGGALQEG